MDSQYGLKMKTTRNETCVLVRKSCGILSAHIIVSSFMELRLS